MTTHKSLAETPRTDGLLFGLVAACKENAMLGYMTDHARTLERELAEATAECLEQARCNGMGGEREAKLRAQLAAARADSERLRCALVRLIDNAGDCLEVEAPSALYDARAAIDSARAKLNPPTP